MPYPFLVGAATAAHQVEGNNVHSDYWLMEHLKHSDFVEPSGAAVDHYNRYKEDLRLLAETGCNAYRFSIEWARIEPQEGVFCDEQIEHYRQVLLCCRDYGLTPVVTLMHFSSPAWLIQKGGWAKPYVIDAFARYAKTVAQELGALLPYICTINEANMGLQLHKITADMLQSAKRKEGSVQVGQNMGLDLKAILLGMLEKGKAFHCSPFAVNTFLMPRSEKKERIVMAAHRAAVEAIRQASPTSRVGLTLSLFDYQALDGGAQRAEQLWYEDFGWYLPYIQTDDFLGVQNYSRKLVDSTGALAPAPDVPVTQMGYEDYPASIGNVLRRAAKSFPGELLVTENGISTDNDARRCAFVREAFDAVLAARQSGVNVIGYLHWSLLDNFEWQAGYSKTFGLVAVDRQTQQRHPKPSLTVLGELAQSLSS